MSPSQVSFVLALVFLIAGSTAKQATPFSPIHPGSIHADHFSPLQGDGVYVEHFAAQDFSSYKLDFASLSSATPVEFDLAGGINFNNDNFAITTEGHITVESEVNNFNIEAPAGHARFEGASFLASAYGTDIVFESVNDDVTVVSERGQISMSGAGIVVEGNFRDGGVSMSSEGVINFGTSPSYYNTGSESMDFSGRNIDINGDGITAETSADMYMYALNKLDVDSDGAMNLGSLDLFEVLALSGPMNVEAAQLNVQTPDFFYEATGSFSMSSVLGGVFMTGSSAIDIKSDDQVKFISNGMGVHATAGGDVSFTSGDSINFASSSGDATASWVISDRLILDSTLDEVNVHANENLSITADGDVSILANQDAHITSQNAFSVSSAGSITHDIDRNMIISTAGLMKFDGESGNIHMEADDDMFVITDSAYRVTAPGISFIIDDDIDMEIQSDFSIHAAENLDISFLNSGSISGSFEVDMKSTGDVSVNADDIDFESGHSVHLSSEGSTIFTIADDVFINAPVSSRFESGDFTFVGTNSFSISAIGEMNYHLDQSFTVNSGSDINFSTALDFNYVGQLWQIEAGADVEIISGRDLQMFAQDEISFISNGIASDTRVTLDAGDNVRFEAGSFFAEGEELAITTNDWHVFARASIDFTADLSLEIDVEQELVLGATGEVIVNADNGIVFTAGADLLIDSTVLYHGDIEFTTDVGSIILNIPDDFDVISGRIESNAGENISIASSSININHAESPADFGNVIFSAGETFDLSANQYRVSARTTELYGTTSMTLTAEQTIDIETFNHKDINIDAGHGILSTATSEFLFSSPVIDIFAAEFATISTSDIAGISITSTTFNGNADMHTNFLAGNTMEFSYNDFFWTAHKAITATTGDFTVNSGTFEMNAYGSGLTMVAQNDVTLNSLNLKSTTGDLLSFVTNQGKTDLSATVNVAFSGGSHDISSNLDMSWSAISDIDFFTADNGFLKFISGGSIFSTTTEDFSLTGFTSDLTKNDGRFGTMRTTAADAHVCIHSTDVTATNFFADSMEWNAYGPEATLDVISEDTTSISSAIGTIGTTAFGWITGDPQFHFDPEVTFGILYRTLEGNFNGISVDSAAGLSAFAGQQFLISANSSSLISTSQNEHDIRVHGFNADISVDVTNGDISVLYTSDGYFTSGNPALPANMELSATKDISILGDSDVVINHLGTTTNEDNLGVLFEAFDDMSYTSQDFEVFANEGGLISWETRGGDVSFTSTTGHNQFRAETGSINMVARGDSIFTAGENIDIDASGDGGSVYLSSGGEQVFSMLATDHKFFVTAEQGEIDFEATTGFHVTAGVDTLFDGKSINVEGGSVLYDAITFIDFTAQEELTMDAQVQFTVDSPIILLSSTEGIDMSAGGNGVTSGITATSVGDITYDSAAGQVSLDALRVFATAADLITIQTENDIIVKSQAKSALDNTITLSAEAGDSLLLADQFFSKADTHSVSSNDVVVTVNTVQISSDSGSIEMSAVGNHEVTTDNFISHAATNVDLTFGNNLNLLSLNDIQFEGLSALEFLGTGSFTANSDSLFFSGFSSTAILESVGAFNIDMILGYSTRSLGSSDIYSPSTVHLETPAGIFTIQSNDEHIVFARENIQISSLDTFSSSSEAFELNTSSFSAVNQVLLDVTTTNVDIFSYKNIEITAVGPILIQAGTRQPIQLIGDSIEIDANDALLNVIGDRLITFTATENGDDGISFDTGDTVWTSTTSTSVFSKRDLAFDATGILTLTQSSFLNAHSHGHGGLFYTGNTVDITSVNNAQFLSDSGNIEMISSTSQSFNSVAMDFVSSHAFGDIRMESNDVTFVVGANMIVQQYNPDFTQDSTQAGHGKLELLADSFVQFSNPSNLSFDSDSDFILNTESGGGSLFSALNLNIAGGNVMHFDTYNGMALSAGTITVSASFDGTLESEIFVTSNDVSFSGVNLNVITSGQEIVLNSVGFIESEAEFTSFLADNRIKVTAERGNLEFDIVGTMDFATAGSIAVSSTGTEGSLEIIADNGAIFTVDDLNFHAGDSIHMGVSTINAAVDLEVISGGDVVFDAGTFVVNANTANFVGRNDGNFKMNSHTINIGTSSDLEFIAKGMLGTIGGRYVLADNYWNGFTAVNEKFKINRNTNGIEVTNVNGHVALVAQNAVDIISEYGSVEFRAVDTIEYLVPNNGQIFFFGIDETSIYGANTGTHKPVPFDREDDYCVTGGCNIFGDCGRFTGGCPPGGSTCTISCPELSAIINDIAEAMVAYGLLNCGNDANWCF